MQSDNMNSYFDKESFLPLVVFILGIYTISKFLVEDYSSGFLAMLLALLFYIINNIYIGNFFGESKFNQYLDDLSEFIAFGLSSVIFAVMFYRNEESLLIMLIVFFFSISTILSMARNRTLKAKNSVGWPVPFNAIFLPIIFYSYLFYLADPGASIFLLYFIFAGVMSGSNYNFLGNLDPKIRHEHEDETTLEEFIDPREEKSKSQNPSMKDQIVDFYDIDENKSKNKKDKNKEDWDEEIDLDEEVKEVDINDKYRELFNPKDFPTETELRDSLDPPKKKLGLFGKLAWKFKKKEEPLFEDKDFPDEKELGETFNDIPKKDKKEEKVENKEKEDKAKPDSKDKKEEKSKEDTKKETANDFENDEGDWDEEIDLEDEHLDRKWT